MEIGEESLKLHEKNKGKIEIRSKFKLENKKDLSLAYTPGVARACQKIAENSHDAYKYTIKGNSVAVISDGSAVLGLGNIGGIASLPVMEGKAILFKEFADIDAYPIILGEQDIDMTVNTIKNIAGGFGGINLEDFKAPECFEIEKRLQDLGIPVMHDDQHGTAVVVLAGLINSIKIKGVKKEEVRIVINGVGAAGVAIAKLLLKYGFSSIVVVDSVGVIYKGREHLTPEKEELAELTNASCNLRLNHSQCVTGGLASAINRSDVFIGVSKPDILTSDMIKTMNKYPIIFALANPVPEIMPDIAKEAGAFIVATGRSDFDNQVNNVLAFPGIFKGALEVGAKKITDEMKIAAAEGLANAVEEPTVDMILPSPLDKSVVSIVAEAVKKAV